MATDESSDQAMNEQQIRTELGETLNQLQALPADAFAQRSRLRDRQTELGRLLRQIEIPGAGDIKDRWSELAAASHLSRPRANPSSPRPGKAAPREDPDSTASGPVRLPRSSGQHQFDLVVQLFPGPPLASGTPSKDS